MKTGLTCLFLSMNIIAGFATENSAIFQNDENKACISHGQERDGTSSVVALEDSFQAGCKKCRKPK